MSSRNTAAVASGLRRISSRRIGPRANARINIFAKMAAASVSTAARMPSDGPGSRANLATVRPTKPPTPQAATPTGWCVAYTSSVHSTASRMAVITPASNGLPSLCGVRGLAP